MMGGNGIRNTCHSVSVIPGMIKKYLGSWVIQSSQTQEWPTLENVFLTTAMHRYRDLRRSPGATPCSFCVFCEFLKQGKNPQWFRSKMHFMPKWSTTYLQYHIVLSFTECSSVGWQSWFTSVMASWQIMVLWSVIHNTHFLWYCYEGCSYLQQKMFLWRIVKSFFNGNSVRDTLWSLFIQMLAGSTSKQKI